MEEVLRFLEKYEIWVYALSGIAGAFFLVRLIGAWQEWRGAQFGLERDNAQRHFGASMTVVIVIALFVMAEFVLVSFVTPALPQASTLPTPTLDLMLTPQPSAAPTAGTPEPEAGMAVASILATAPASQCIIGQLEWIEPSNGSEVSDRVTLRGSVNMPDVGFYKYEYSTPGSSEWYTIAGGNQLVTAETNNEIGVWNTSEMLPGDYLLRLVAMDNDTQALGACTINIRILPPTD